MLFLSVINRSLTTGGVSGQTTTFKFRSSSSMKPGAADPDAAARRLLALEGLSLLDVTSTVVELCRRRSELTPCTWPRL